MKCRIVLLSFVLTLIAQVPGLVADADAGVRLGGGIHYLRYLGDIKETEKFDDDALGYMASLLFAGSALKLEMDVEFVPDFAGTSEMLIEPQAYLFLGSLIYAGAGIGIGRFEEEWFDDPFYALRGGLDLDFGGMDLDLFVAYRFLDTEVLKDLDDEDWDSVTFGVLLRFGD